ncbi:hypothetical protein DXB92_06285 [Ruminococcus sp. OM06-36AC]|nr:hypothetical protein DXB92_06285 [Ruminococcus sp. OM06-36AC]
MPAEFLCNLPKNLTTHLTHKLYSVFPLFRCVSSFCNYHIIIGGRSKHKTVPKLQSFFGTVFS